MDLAKFIDLLTSGRLWLTNMEELARGDPYEGLPTTGMFPHRRWKRIDEVPPVLRDEIIGYFPDEQLSPDDAFREWMMIEELRWSRPEQMRPTLFINCWHAARSESAAMWKIYGAPGAGVAIVSNSSRIRAAVAHAPESLYLGSVQYVEFDQPSRDTGVNFDLAVIKRDSFDYEREVRLLYWKTEGLCLLPGGASWNSETLRFDKNADHDTGPPAPGVHISCELNDLIEKVIVSPEAPAWQLSMIERIRDCMGLSFPIVASKLLTIPEKIS